MSATQAVETIACTLRDLDDADLAQAVKVAKAYRDMAQRSTKDYLAVRRFDRIAMLLESDQDGRAFVGQLGES